MFALFHSGFEHESMQKKSQKQCIALVEVQKECRIRTQITKDGFKTKDKVVVTHSKFVNSFCEKGKSLTSRS